MSTTTVDTELLEHLKGTVESFSFDNELLTERLADLELQMEDEGWTRLGVEMEREFTRDGLDRIIAISRLMAMKNPLIKRGVKLTSHYVWGQSVEVSAEDDTLNETVVQPFLDDPGNRAELFSAQARLLADEALSTDANLFFTLFTRVDARVFVRSIEVPEIREVICNPEDRNEPWFYRRRWTERRLDERSGAPRVSTREELYPDWRYAMNTTQRSAQQYGLPVRWDAPVMHVRTGHQRGMRFGVPETYAALDWARAYKLFLEDWASIVRSLSRFAWQLSVKRKAGQAAQKIGSQMTAAGREKNPSPVTGAVFTATEGNELRPIPKTDAAIASEDGVWLAKMVAAALGWPYPILMGDPDMGNLATAKTLDRPTELILQGRQEMWADVIRDLLTYAISKSKLAASGVGETITVSFPPIREHEVKELVEAIVQAHTTDLAPYDVILRLLMEALGVDDIDEILARFPDDFDQRRQRDMELGDELIRRARAGQDPIPEET